MAERLDKLLANTGRWSRSEAKAVIRAGRVTAAGQTVTAPESKWEPGDVQVDGQGLGNTGFTYLMLHKPQGVVSATNDKRERTVLDLLPPEYRGLFPVGRLDKDTEGLLLLTDDGPLAHALTSPRRHVDKVYRVTVTGALTEDDVGALRSGLRLGDGLDCLPAELVLTGDPCVGLLTLHEGKFHQVKRMMAALGKPVVALKRLSMGPLVLDEELKPGQFRALTPQERKALGV